MRCSLVIFSLGVHDCNDSSRSDVLPIETTLRVWDCLFYEGSKILLRVAVALVAMNSVEILAARDFTTLAARDGN